MTSIYTFITTFGYNVWSLICSLGQTISQINATVSFDFRQGLNVGQLMSYMTSSTNPFYTCVHELGLSGPIIDNLTKAINFLLAIPSAIVSKLLSIMNIHSISNPLLALVCIIVSLGIAYMLIHTISRMVRMVKDIINPIN